MTDRYRVEVRWLRNKANRIYKRYVVVDYRTMVDLSKPVTRPTAYAKARALNSATFHDTDRSAS